jgi:hypothetical protein
MKEIEQAKQMVEEMMSKMPILVIPTKSSMADEFSCDIDFKSSFPNAKQCALIAVQMIINANPHSNPLNTIVHSTMQYWLDVKTEIQNL